MPRSHRRIGYTLIELLVVIGIISVSMSLLAPAVMRVRENSNGVSCSNNLHQIGLAVHGFENDHGILPRCWGGFPDGHPPPSNYISGSLFHIVLPYLGQETLFQSSYNPSISANGWYDWS